MMTSMKKAAILLAAAGIAIPASALNILVSNDDGYGSYGITALQASLEAAGHSVYVVAPAENQSGKSGGINTDYGEAVEFTEHVQGKQWAVEGTPADSVSAGLFGLIPAVLPAGESIDLVVSGINDGENIAKFVNASGTVGAAMYALRRGVPAIAVSVGQDIAGLRAVGEVKDELDAALAAGDYAAIPALQQQLYALYGQTVANAHVGADTAAALIPQLIDQLGEDGLVEGLGLNVNVPSGAFTPKGIRVVRSGNAQAFDLLIVSDGNGGLVLDSEADNFLAAANLGTPVPEAYFTPDLNAEGEAFAYGYTTISIVDGNIDASVFTMFKANWTACKLRDIAEVEIFWCGFRR